MQGARAERFEGLVAAGRWEWDVGDNTLRWSPQLARIYGLSPGDAPQGYEGFLGMVYPDDVAHTKAVVDRVFQEREDTEYQHRIVRKDGHVRVLRSLVHVDTDEAGDVVRLSGACQDVTEQVELTERLRRLQGLAAAGTVAAGLSHDLNNLVGAVVLLTGAMARNGNRRDEELVAQLHGVAARSSAIAKRIQTLARHVRGKAENLALTDEVERIAGTLKPILTQRFSLDVTAQGNVGTVRIDQLDLERVLWNLVLNARDAQPAGGPIRVAVESVAVIGDGRTGEYYRVTVSDDGVGMDDVTAAHIFEPFYSTKGEAGTGLGLAVVLDIVETAGGFVTAETRQGAGTKIRVHLPPSD